MKQVCFSAIQVILICVAATGYVKSQTAGTGVYTGTVQHSPVIEQTDDVINKEVRKEINIKAVRHFKMKYGKVRGEKWWKISSGFISGFTVNGVRYSVYYDTKGGWLQSCQWYGQDLLAADVKNNINKCYEGYDIMMVAEIEYPDRQSMLVQLKNRQTQQPKIITYNNGAQLADDN
ncbi:hypothetical protein [Foetidibacter luteolus]|uniref:hypothetical protein n=1 Tax=Foetidibacter luteolus TaxID=2608880 RepID=UPI00129BCED2|nr:hypothetical protein [Foetidibacter luteolus]